MIREKTWSEFRDSGLLWFINTTLHAFGWAIVVKTDDDGNEVAFPARVKYRGFSEQSNDSGYKKITNYMCETAEELRNEIEE